MGYAVNLDQLVKLIGFGRDCSCVGPRALVSGVEEQIDVHRLGLSAYELQHRLVEPRHRDLGDLRSFTERVLGGIELDRERRSVQRAVRKQANARGQFSFDHLPRVGWQAADGLHLEMIRTSGRPFRISSPNTGISSPPASSAT